MARGTINFDTVRKIGLALPGVEESTAYGSPALQVVGQFELQSEKREAPYLTMDANYIRRGHTLPLVSSESRGTHPH